jgi:uncharacterized protein (DUF608 family)
MTVVDPQASRGTEAQAKERKIAGKVYRDEHTGEISFPLGGLGTGCIGLAGNGRLVDWEIFNRPNKGSVNGFSHFAVKAERAGSVLDARVLQGDLKIPYSGDVSAPKWGSFGFGPRREYLAGMPHFTRVDFHGTYPVAELHFVDAAFPGQIVLRAFNPFIPLNDVDSGIPAAFFEFEILNNTDAPLDYSLAGILSNPLGANNCNDLRQNGGMTSLHLTSDGVKPDSLRYGDLTLATDAPVTSWQQYWFRGAWFDSLEVYWREWTAPGSLQNRVYAPTAAGERNEGMLAGHLTLAPRETGRLRFVISWNFPNCENYWNEKARAAAEAAGMPNAWKNYYATIWPDSQASARYALAEWDRLYGQTRLFQEALFSSDLPPAALDAVSANLSTLKTPTVMRLEDGTFYGWEGCHVAEGCCEGSCTHVWNYAQTLPFLFPKLERSMRVADYRYNLRPDGGMYFRLMLPLGVPTDGGQVGRPCADGQFGGVMKAYRDWKICGDDEWLRELWPAIKRSIEFAWSPENEDRWDPDKTGVLWGRQHHTLDMELFGPNSWLTGFYLGALKAGAEMAEYLGELATAQEYRALFTKGKAWADEHLFNGAYYHQLIDLKDKSMIEQFERGSSAAVGGGALSAYWNGEHGEIKYQIAEGSEIDQVLAQWHANLYGLGEIFDPEQVKTTHRSLWKYNFKTSSRSEYNPCRVYTLNDEAGLIICVWPEGVYKPIIPLPYAQETQNGYEYAAAIQMIQTGMVEEGMAAIEAIRDRYDGRKRNPWNEIECGSNYARSMAAYSLLNTFAGFSFDMGRRMVGFEPIRLQDGRFRCFWSLDCGWGVFTREKNETTIQVLYGTLPLSLLRLPYLAGGSVAAVMLDGNAAVYCLENGDLCFTPSIVVSAGSTLRVRHGGQ